MINNIKGILGLDEKTKERVQIIEQLITQRYQDYRDPWGFDLETAITSLKVVLPFYLHYFNVRVRGLENLTDEACMAVANHTGQIPLDAVLITTMYAFEPEKPRIMHGMVDRFVMKLPFLADYYGRTGAILGDRENCHYLLNKNESILAFPEGVRGVSKSTPDFYQVQSFSDGFFRIAQSKKVPIQPIAVIGAEEMFPLVWHSPMLKVLFKKLWGIPPLPLSANVIPLPAPIDLHILPKVNPIEGLNPDGPASEIRPEVEKIEKAIQITINENLKEKRTVSSNMKELVSKFL